MPKNKQANYTAVAKKISKLSISCLEDLRLESLIKNNFSACTRLAESNMKEIENKIKADRNATIKSEFNSIRSNVKKDFINPVNKIINNIKKYHETYSGLLDKVKTIPNNYELSNNLTIIKSNINKLEKSFSSYLISANNINDKIENLSIKVNNHESLKSINKIEDKIDKLAESIHKIIVNKEDFSLSTRSSLSNKIYSLSKMSSQLVNNVNVKHEEVSGTNKFKMSA